MICQEFWTNRYHSFRLYSKAESFVYFSTRIQRQGGTIVFEVGAQNYFASGASENCLLLLYLPLLTL
jgi:hypothetical protein